MNHFPPLHSLVAHILRGARALEKKGDAVFREFGLTTQYFHILLLLEHSASPVLASALADELVTTRSNVTGIVARMERQGLILRERVPGDRRAASLRPTPKGRRSYHAAAAAYQKHLDILARSLPAKAVPAAQATLARLILLAN